MTNTPIPFVDLRAQYAAIGSEIQQAISAVLEGCDYILGPEVERFEREFADYCGVPYAVGVGNGVDALTLSARALGIGPGDEVIVPAMTFVATALAFSLVGAKPVLVDVEADTALIDPARIEGAITSRTKAICPVHLFGQCADMDAVKAVAARHGLSVIEDAAQAHGATFNGVRAGALGHTGCFSFYPAKNLGAYGDGGLVSVADPAAYERLLALRNYGSKVKYHHDIQGTNSRLDVIQAAALRVKLRHLEGWNAARRGHARRYDDVLADVPNVRRTRYRDGSVYHLYVVRVPDRDAVLARLHTAGIGAAIHYPFAVHQSACYADLEYGEGSFPMAENWAANCLSLPLYPELPSDAPERVAEVLRRA
jgi:dTDP-4-amino-4,6-dideoxygalactose transaminase